MHKHEKEFKKLGEKIKELRIKNNMSIKKLSEKTGINTSYLYKIEQGKAYGICIEKHLYKICCAFKIKISELFENF